MVTAFLPGIRPRYTSLEIEFEDNGTVTLQVWQGDRAGFRTRADKTEYDLLTEQEALDVLVAYLDGLGFGLGL